MRRKQAIILSADVVGYSRMMHVDDIGTLAALKALWAEVVNPTLRQHDGRVFKLLGDGLLAEFRDAAAAARAATEIQDATLARTADQPEDQKIHLRIAINCGPAVEEGLDLFGDVVNIAARLQEVAETGGIALSGTAFDQLEAETTRHFVNSGERHFKNIEDPVTVWLRPGKAMPGTAPPSIPDHQPARPSLAVLPFASQLADHPSGTRDFFSDGMSEDIVSALSKFGWLSVIARSTMLSYRNRQVTPAEVAAELGVQYVLKGNVRHAGDRVRVSVELSDTETAGQLWNQRFDRDLVDIFAIQDEITNAIAAAIAPEIGRAERGRAARTPPTEVNAWLLYQKALAMIDVNVEATLNEVISTCEAVHGLDAKFAPAYALAARARVQIAQNHRPQNYDTLIAAANDDTKIALALSPQDAVILAIASRVQFGIGRLDLAVAYAKEAAGLNPNSVDAHYALGLAYTVSGEPREAIEFLDKAIAMSPLDQSLHYFLFVRAMALFHLGRNGACVESAERAITLGQCPIWVYAVLPIAYARTGLVELQQRALANLYQEKPGFSVTFAQSGLRRVSPVFLDAFLHGLREIGVPEE